MCVGVRHVKRERCGYQFTERQEAGAWTRVHTWIALYWASSGTLGGSDEDLRCTMTDRMDCSSMTQHWSMVGSGAENQQHSTRRCG